jgi:Arc/MetJ-type ribon-helix-helix transcriptional regulator
VSTKSAIGDLAGIIGGPVESSPAAATKRQPRARPERAASPSAARVVEIQPRLLDDPNEQSDRITVILPISLLTQVDGRVATLRRKKKVSVSGYIEAALRELLATGEHDLEALERYRITARRSVSKVR